jgi:predicted transcriptional regulator of viral defense system
MSEWGRVIGFLPAFVEAVTQQGGPNWRRCSAPNRLQRIPEQVKWSLNRLPPLSTILRVSFSRSRHQVRFKVFINYYDNSLTAYYRSVICFMSKVANYAQVNGLQLLDAAVQQFGPIFTIDQVETLANQVAPRSRLRWYMSALIRSGRLEPLKRGTYALKAPPPGMEIHPFAVAMALIQPGAISHWSALAHHGVTTQVHRMVQVSVPRKVVTPEMRQGKAYRPRGRSAWKAAGVEVEIIHIQPRAFFGHQKIWISSWQQVTITDPERTAALDLVARPEVLAACRLLWTSWKKFCRVSTCRH